MPSVEMSLGEKLRVKGSYEGKVVPLITDVSKEFGGLEENASPSEMVVAAVGACMLSMMGLVSKKLGVDIEGTRAEIQYEYTPDHRIGKIEVTIRCPNMVDESAALQLEKAAMRCPVYRSLNSNIKKEHHFHWGEVLHCV